ncbi:LPS assembly lipoprotein LptE [Aquabacterium sp. J223]|uniref:LPS-assembly lipoprotein LptE n=1 Tax=Aquabacterium sp. J223 TaxID=2898431 RepID=UPI0021ADDB45|nr:LPS assembly lipoprotein LptE [Aquabacterium sp. J223]UUX95891.1 LPS assembly lipoprotein LptE [Aquabacterium sp. J223]
MRTALPRRGLLAVLAAAGALAGCGFQLRRAPDLAVTRIHLSGFAGRSTMAAELQRQAGSAIAWVPAPEQSQVVVHAFTDRRERVVVAIASAGQVRELQLRVRLVYELRSPAGAEVLPRTELLQRRDMSFSETDALAKEQEEQELYRAMEADIAAQLLRRLAAVRP